MHNVFTIKLFQDFQYVQTRFIDMVEMMSGGIELMFIGMGIVFSFLTMLVIAINVMSSLIQRFLPETQISQSKVIVPTLSSSIDKSTVAAIAAAIHQYRNKIK